jgi:hypothetical protein
MVGKFTILRIEKTILSYMHMYIDDIVFTSNDSKKHANQMLRTANDTRSNIKLVFAFKNCIFALCFWLATKKELFQYQSVTTCVRTLCGIIHPIILDTHVITFFEVLFFELRDVPPS